MSKRKRRQTQVDEPESVEPEVISTPAGSTAPTPSNRVRASQIRARARAGGFLTPEDAAWLADYDQARAAAKDLREGSVGASRGRRVSYTEEEHEAMGVGDSVVAQAAAAGAMTREEGRRLDSLIAVGITALRTATETYKSMVDQLLERNRQLEKSHIGMMEAIRDNYMGRTEAEAQLVADQIVKEAGGDNDQLMTLANQLLPHLLAASEKDGGDAAFRRKPGPDKKS